MLQKPKLWIYYEPYLLHHSFATGFWPVSAIFHSRACEVQKQRLLNLWHKSIKPSLSQVFGLCYGAAGVGKTLSARRYANWDLASPLIENWNSRRGFMRKKINEASAHSRTVFHTPTVMGTLHDLKETLVDHIGTVDNCIDDHLNRHVRWDYRKDGCTLRCLSLMRLSACQ